MFGPVIFYKHTIPAGTREVALEQTISESQTYSCVDVFYEPKRAVRCEMFVETSDRSATPCRRYGRFRGAAA